ncbi:MAG: cobalt-precorrin-5B (C(1))-methyltransferase, partial [Methanomicrobium sp.]|nr:cobalt-precorrin-5B (C(1))-methyltransferase [Methanomicrobium sp.]
LELVRTGFGVLTAGGKVLKRGFTTGSTASAAVYAAVASLKSPVSSSPILFPCGIRADIPATGKNGVGEAKKYSGDYPSDITSGILIRAVAEPADEISVDTGVGIGRYDRDTPRYKKGAPAIGKNAFEEILKAAAEGCRFAGIKGAKVILTIPDGERIGQLTLNPRIGVVGGISIVGTTGFVEPWDDHLSETIGERIEKADKVVVTTGRIGLRYSRLLFPEHEVVLAGSKISEALTAAEKCKNAVICGLPGLILRYFNPDVALSRGFSTVEELVASENGIAAMNFELDAAKARYPWLRIVIIDRNGKVIGDTK